MSDKRKQLTNVATDIVQQGGLQSLSFRTLADSVGIKSSSVHYHFPEKSDLARSLIEQYSLAFFDQLQLMTTQRAGLKKRISGFIAVFESVASDNKLCLCGMLAAEVEQLSAENRQLLDLFFHKMERWLVELLSAYPDEIQCTLSHRKLARVLISGLEGGLLLDRISGGSRHVKAHKDLFLSLL